MYTVGEIILMYVKAFAVGGAICTIAQLLINYTKLTSGKILVFFMLAGVVLQTFGLYGYLIEFAGAGASVPISGFGYILVEGAKKGAKISFYKAITGGINGAAAGITAAIFFGYFFALFFKARTKVN